MSKQFIKVTNQIEMFLSSNSGHNNEIVVMNSGLTMTEKALVQWGYANVIVEFDD